jgi:hypothetical protein
MTLTDTMEGSYLGCHLNDPGGGLQTDLEILGTLPPTNLSWSLGTFLVANAEAAMVDTPTMMGTRTALPAKTTYIQKEKT